MISCCFFERSCYVIKFNVGIMLVFTLVVSFFQKSNGFGMGLSCDFFVFYYFFLRLYNCLQKNKLSSFELG